MSYHYFGRLLLALVCCFYAGSMAALTDDAATVLKLHLKDGTAPTYILGKDTKITFANANMCFSASDYQFEVPLSDIVKWTYEDYTSGIDEVAGNGITITRNGDVITISGMAEGCDVAVYATDGRLIHSGRSSATVYVVRADNWTPGVYVIKAENSSFKIVKL